MCLLTGGQSGQFLYSGGSQEAGKTLLQRDLLDINADLVPLGILDGGESAHPPAPPGAESKHVSPLTDKTVGERTLGFFSLV